MYLTSIYLRHHQGPLDTFWKIRDSDGFILNNDGIYLLIYLIYLFYLIYCYYIYILSNLYLSYLSIGTKSACVHQWDRWYKDLHKFVDSKLYD